MKLRKLSPKWKDHFSHAQLFYNSLTPIEKKHLTNAYSFELDHCEDPVVYNRLVERLTEIDLSLAQAVAVNVGAPTPTKQTRPNHGRTSAGLSQVDVNERTPFIQPTIASRRIALLIAEGYDATSFNAMYGAIKAGGALPFVIAPKRQAVKAASGGGEVVPDHFLNGMRSTMFDAVFVPGGKDSVDTLCSMGLARFWVREAFGHCKAIGAVGEGVRLVQAAVQECGTYELAGVGGKTGVIDWYGVVTAEQGTEIKEVPKLVKGAAGFAEQFFWNIGQHRNWAREMDGWVDMVTV